MKTLLPFLACLFFYATCTAQLLTIDSSFTSVDSGTTFKLVNGAISFHEAASCRPVKSFSMNADPVSHQLTNNVTGVVEYYDNGQVKRETSQSWDAVLNMYINSLRTTYTYIDSNANHHNDLSEIWINGSWNNFQRIISTYDENGDLTLLNQELWDSTDGNWQKYFETFYFNNSFGKPDSVINNSFQNDTLVNKSKNLFIYDDTLVVQLIVQNLENNRWENSFRSTNTYDSANNLIFDISENFINGYWDTASRGYITYNVLRKPLTGYSESISTGSHLWIRNDKYSWVYDTAGYLAEQKIYIYMASQIIDMVKSVYHRIPCDNIGAVKILLCNPVGNGTVVSNSTGTRFQWQVSTSDSSYTNIYDGENYTGTGSYRLQLSGIPSAWTGFKYRCLSDGNAGREYIIKFVNEWTGTADTLFNNPSNWSCGNIPDQNTDVLISSGTIIVSSDVTIRSMTINPGAAVKVRPGVHLDITH